MIISLQKPMRDQQKILPEVSCWYHEIKHVKKYKHRKIASTSHPTLFFATRIYIWIYCCQQQFFHSDSGFVYDFIGVCRQREAYCREPGCCWDREEEKKDSEQPLFMHTQPKIWTTHTHTHKTAPAPLPVVSADWRVNRPIFMWEICWEQQCGRSGWCHLPHWAARSTLSIALSLCPSQRRRLSLCEGQREIIR